MADTTNLVQAVLHGGFAPATAGNPRPYGMPPFVLVLDDAQIAAVLSALATTGLFGAVAFVDEKMREIGEKTNSTGERLAVMTALNLAHELLSIKLPGGFDMQEFRRRIAGMQARLDEAMASQEQLF